MDLLDPFEAGPGVLDLNVSCIPQTLATCGNLSSGGSLGPGFALGTDHARGLLRHLLHVSPIF